MSLPFTPLGNRVVVVADRDDRAPEATESGLIVAKSLAAAVEGSDAEDSWFVGTVVGLGPLVTAFDVRPYVVHRLRKWLDGCQMVSLREFLADIESLPADCPDPVQIGDHVCFSWAAGQELVIDGDKYLILDAREILAVLNPERQECVHG